MPDPLSTEFPDLRLRDLVKLSAPITIRSPGRGSGRSDRRTSTIMVSLTKRPALNSVIRSGARAMMRIGRSSDVVAEIQTAAAAMDGLA
jgi:hypothetical protein